MSTGTAVATGDIITAAKQNLKQEDGRDLAALGVLDQSGAGAQELLFTCSENLSADRALTLVVNDAARTIDLSGNLTLAGDLITSGGHAVTLTTTGATGVTLPTTGTLATLLGTETFQNKTLQGATLTGTLTCTTQQISLTTGNVTISGAGYISLGANAAAAGYLRLPNATYITARNAANSADINMIEVSATDFVRLGTASVEISTANLITLTFTNPGAARTITFGDPGGADSVVYLAATQALTNKTLTAPVLAGTITGTPTFSGATITLTGGTINLTAGAAYVIGTTDANDLILKAGGANRLAVDDTIGQLIVYQATANVTLIFSDPGAARNVTFADPGGHDNVAYLAATQTLTNKTIGSATLNITAGAAATLGTSDNNTLTIKTNNVDKFVFTVTLGQFTVKQGTADYTLAFADPGAARTITIADPGGAATLAYINQAQTISAAHTFSGGPIFSRAGLAATFTNTTDAASVQIAIFEGNRATMADNDAAYISLQLSDSAGNQDEGARITWQATTVLDGATQDTDLIFAALNNNALSTMLTLDGSANQMQASRPLYISLAGNGLQVEETTDGASVQVAIFEGNRATIADNDEAYITLRLSDSGGTQDEGARITWKATTVLAGATQDTDLILSALFNNALTTFITLDGSASEVVLAQNLRLPSAGSIFLNQATANYTVNWNDPGAARTLTIPDPGGNDSFVFLAATQTLSGKTISLSGDLTLSAALDIVVQAATAAAMEFNDGTTKVYALDTRIATDNVAVHSFDATNAQFVSAAGSTWRLVQHEAVTVTLTGGVGVTAMDGLSLYLTAVTLAADGATTVTTASQLYLTPVTAGANMTITNNRMINTSVAGCYLTSGGVWTDASSIAHKTDIKAVNPSAKLGKMLKELKVVSFRRKDPSDGGFERYGLLAEEAPDYVASPNHDGIAPGHVAGFALAALKWLQKENEGLKDRIAKLEAQLATT